MLRFSKDAPVALAVLFSLQFTSLPLVRSGGFQKFLGFRYNNSIYPRGVCIFRGWFDVARFAGHKNRGSCEWKERAQKGELVSFESQRRTLQRRIMEFRTFTRNILPFHLEPFL